METNNINSQYIDVNEYFYDYYGSQNLLSLLLEAQCFMENNTNANKHQINALYETIINKVLDSLTKN